MKKKSTHYAVNYRKALGSSRRCGTCTMYRGPNDCTSVMPPIRAEDVCDIYERDREKALENKSI